MAAPAYTIGKDELLLITVKWTGGVNKGTSNVLELNIRCYTAAEVQALIDETVNDDCDVIGVDLYDFKRRIGQDISEDFDVRTWAEREEDRREQEDADEIAQDRILRRGSAVYSTLNHVQQGIHARAGL